MQPYEMEEQMATMLSVLVGVIATRMPSYQQRKKEWHHWKYKSSKIKVRPTGQQHSTNIERRGLARNSNDKNEFNNNSIRNSTSR